MEIEHITIKCRNNNTKVITTTKLSSEDAIGFSFEFEWLINLYEFSETIAQRTLKNEVTLDCFRYSVEYSFMNTIA